MNTLRTDFTLPDYYKIVITPYWLLGFVEGDGSFSLSLGDTFPLRFNISQVKPDKIVLEEIKNYFLNIYQSMPEDKLFKSRSSRATVSTYVQIIEKKIKGLEPNQDSSFDTSSVQKIMKIKPVLNLNINDHKFLINIILPFFNKLKFLTALAPPNLTGKGAYAQIFYIRIYIVVNRNF